MDYLLIPAETATRAAQVWIGSTVDRAVNGQDAWIEHVTSGRRWPLANWTEWHAPDGGSFVRHQRVTLSGLQPATSYELALRVAGVERASGVVTTLPERLPRLDEPPFVLLLGSCFSRRQDGAGDVGRTFTGLRGAARPAMKLLVGDQVYLDSPWYRFLIRWSDATLGRVFLRQYLETWGQAGHLQGFHHLLKQGANYFSSDDHEFWNNAPFYASYAVNTWTRHGRDAWWEHAASLYRVFQAGQSRAEVQIGQLRMLMLDTRLNRRRDRTAFLQPEDFAALRQWVGDLRGPGILVLGQPLFARPARLRGYLFDWNLPDFSQYADVCRLLMTSRQSIIVLTGDVHYGRVASATLPTGSELVEIISSPMALVDPSVGGQWHPAPDRFPAAAVEGVASVPVHTESGWRLAENHFVTLELHEKGGGLRIRARAWPTRRRGDQPRSRPVLERDFMRMA